jgi:hypothetical protein
MNPPSDVVVTVIHEYSWQSVVAFAVCCSVLIAGFVWAVLRASK